MAEVGVTCPAHSRVATRTHSERSAVEFGRRNTEIRPATPLRDPQRPTLRPVPRQTNRPSCRRTTSLRTSRSKNPEISCLERYCGSARRKKHERRFDIWSSELIWIRDHRIFNPTQQDIENLLAAQCHMGSKNLQVRDGSLDGRSGKGHIMSSEAHKLCRPIWSRTSGRPGPMAST